MLFRQLFPDLSLGAGYVEDELHEIAKTSPKNYPEADKIPEACYEEVKKIEEKKLEPLVSDEQAQEIEFMLNRCDPAYKKEVDDYLAKTNVIAYRVPLHMHKKITIAAKAKGDDYQKSKEKPVETPVEAVNE